MLERNKTRILPLNAKKIVNLQLSLEYDLKFAVGYFIFHKF